MKFRKEKESGQHKSGDILPLLEESTLIEYIQLGMVTLSCVVIVK